MPRNRYKVHCQVAGCRAWAMRGDTHCHSHRDRELGPSGGGAPPGNLNALPTGEYAHPYHRTDLQCLAHQVVHEPDQLTRPIDSKKEKRYRNNN